MAKLDALIIENVKERLFTPERLAKILESLLEGQYAKNRAVEDRRAALGAEFAAANEERVDALKTQRDLAQASLDRIAAQANTRAMITPNRLVARAVRAKEGRGVRASAPVNM